MNYKKTNAASSTITRNQIDLDKQTGNIYESLVIISRRANQISTDNREQIEISKFYERLPKPTLIAIQEFLEGKIYYRNPNRDNQ